MLIGTYYEAANSGALFSHALLTEKLHLECEKKRGMGGEGSSGIRNYKKDWRRKKQKENQGIEDHHKEILLAGIFEGFGEKETAAYATSYVSKQVRDWFYNQILPESENGAFVEQNLYASIEKVLLGCRKHLADYGRKRQCRLGSSAYILICIEKTMHLFYVGPGRGYVFGEGVYTLSESRTEGEERVGLLGTYPYYGLNYSRMPCEGKVLFLGTSQIGGCLDLRTIRDALDTKHMQTSFQLERRLARIVHLAEQACENPDMCALAITFTGAYGKDWE